MKGKTKHVKALLQGGVEDYITWAEKKSKGLRQVAARQEDANQRARDTRLAEKYQQDADHAKNYLAEIRAPKRKDNLATILSEQEQRKKAGKARVAHQRQLKENARLKRSNARPRKEGEALPKCNQWRTHDSQGTVRFLEAFNESEARRLCLELGYTFIEKSK